MIWTYADHEELSLAAAGLVVQQAQQAKQAEGRFSLVLSGGDTPRRTYELLAQPPLRDEVPWQYVDIFWGDERCVPSDDPRSNALMARQALLDQVPVPGDQVHPIDCAADPPQAARAYERLLRGYFGSSQPPRFDMILLGLGEDGHTASLFPGEEALKEEKRWAVEVYHPEQGIFRVTLTAPIINQAALVVFIVSGADKAAILQRVIQGPRDPLQLPAQLIAPQNGALVWLVDEEAGSRLQRSV